MKAIIVAAGPSSCLNPITNKMPKCLLKVGGQTMLERALEALRENGIKDTAAPACWKANIVSTSQFVPGARSMSTLTLLIRLPPLSLKVRRLPLIPHSETAWLRLLHSYLAWRAILTTDSPPASGPLPLFASESLVSILKSPGENMNSPSQKLKPVHRYHLAS